MDGLPGLLGAAFDARGNGAYLFGMRHAAGSGRVQQVMPTEGWYRGICLRSLHWKTATRWTYRKDEDTLDDLRAVQVVNGVPRVPEQQLKSKG